MSGTAKLTRWAAVRDAATERSSLSLAFIGLVVGLVSYFVAREAQIPLWLFFFAVSALIIVVFILLHALKLLDDAEDNLLPDVRATLEEEEGECRLILLLDPSELFGIFSRVSIYNKDQNTGFEKLIGYGEVLNIQGDGKIQVVVEEWSEAGKKQIDALKNQSAQALASTLVRPSAPKPEGKHGLSVTDLDRIFAAAQTLIARQQGTEND